MTSAQTEAGTSSRPLRLWPGVLIVAVQWFTRFVVPVVAPGGTAVGVLGGLVGGLAIVVWWAFFSRAQWSERAGAIILMIVALAATPLFLHESIATGAQGLLFFILVIPGLSLAFVVWAVASRRLSHGPRRASMVATILLACGVWTLARTGGFTGDFSNDLAWRWAPTPEERLLAEAGDEPTLRPPALAATDAPEERLPAPGGDEPALAPAEAEVPEARLPADAGDEPAALPAALAATETGADWPGFRGPDRDSRIPGVRIATDWSASPPVELWRRPVGPGWSSFSVRGDLFYTQEQRGDEEVVAAYRVTTGEPVWRHDDAARFWESNGGAGPRATPTIGDSRVYTFGATGLLNALDADHGAVVWSRNVASDTGTPTPYWGFSSSPLLVGDVVIVAAVGTLAAYEVATGTPRWVGPTGGDGYSSPHLVALEGVTQVLLMSGTGVTSVAPADGRVLWEHAWPTGARIVQPALTADGDLLISGGGIAGMRRVTVGHGPGGWTTDERWTSNRLKPYFSDFVVHDGHAYGFDGSILACLDVETGERKWKGGRYGQGQLVLLPDENVLLVLSEEGELALVGAAPDGFTELARVPALDGKTWNHPVLVGDVLLIRNGEEMAAFRLPLPLPGK